MFALQLEDSAYSGFYISYTKETKYINIKHI